MQKLEITVSAENWGAAKAVLAEVGVGENAKVTHRSIAGLYIVAIERDVILTDEDYAVIRDNPQVAVLSDSESHQRVREVLDNVYEVEIRLRKLLLHVSDLVESYFDILKTKHTQGYVQKNAVSISGNLDPITSHLTLGEMKDILGLDLSWAKRSLTLQELIDVAGAVSDFADFKLALHEKARPMTMWDVIAKNVLRSKHTWNDVGGKLNKLKDFRDRSAHYQILTEQNRIELITKANEILEITSLPVRRLTPLEEKNLAKASEAVADAVKRVQPLSFTGDFFGNSSIATVPQLQVTQAYDAITRIAGQIKPLSLSIGEYPEFGVANAAIINTAINISTIAGNLSLPTLQNESVLKSLQAQESVLSRFAQTQLPPDKDEEND